MKNLFTAILIAVVSTSVFAAEYYVYDYKASIKRLDYVLTTKKVAKVDTVIQKYKVASDTIKGYPAFEQPVQPLFGQQADAVAHLHTRQFLVAQAHEAHLFGDGHHVAMPANWLR